MSGQPDTIFALASAPGRAGIAVVRVSGPKAAAALLALAPGLKGPPPPRYAVRADLYAAESSPGGGAEGARALIDRALVLWFPGPASFTGEDVAEFHVHGGQAVLDALMTSLGAGPGMRPAAPGEFSRRAFENGKMDLTAVEAIADLVDAETSAQRIQALAQMGGALARLYDGWRERLIAAMAYAETAIDFAEEDIPDDLARQSRATLKEIADDIRVHLADDGIGERIRGGFRIALTGAPNVGKSSLMNALAKRDVAIVSDIAGTTRDVIEVPLDLGGFAAMLVDTAGIRESEDAIEREGVRRALDQAQAADIRIALFDASTGPEAAAGDPRVIQVANKIDLLGPDESAPSGALPLSLKSGDGLDGLIAQLTARLKAIAANRGAASVPLTRARHRQALEACLEALDRAYAGACDGRAAELVAEDIRVGAQALGRITGRVDVEDLLDKIFRDFCIGK